MVDGRGLTRRAALGLVAAGGVTMLTETFGFSNAVASRAASVSTADDPNALVGLDVATSVTKNQVSDLVDVTNNRSETISVTVSLINGDGGTTSDLYFNGSNVGDSVTFDLAPGNSKLVRVETTLNDGSVLDFNVSATSADFDFTADRTTDVVAGNTANAVTIQQFSDLSADPGADEFTVGTATGKDDDGDDDLDYAAFAVFDADGNKVGSTTDSSQIEQNGAKYQLQGGNESITFAADEDVVAGETYTFRFKLYDVDGNSATEYLDVTA